MDSTQWAYVAGFLDGDGSIILQLKPRPDYRYGFQIKATVSFFQSGQGRHVLQWLQQRIGLGRLRRRKDGIWEYNIEGWEPVLHFLYAVRPYVVAKKPQVEEAISLLEEMRANRHATPEQFVSWAQRVESYQALNYSKKRRYTANDVRRFLSSKGLLPSP